LQQEQLQLLDRTLNGIVRTLVEGLQLAAPSAFARASMVRACVEHLTADLPLEQRWRIRMAGTLAYVGCLALPDDVVVAAFTGSRLEPEMEARFLRHAELGAQLLAEIPRLEDVATIVGAQHTGAKAEDGETVNLGVRLLRLAQANCAESKAGGTSQAILVGLRKRFPGDGDYVARLATFRPQAPEENAVVEGTVAELTDGCVLARSVITLDGALLLAEGSEITPVLRFRLAEYVRSKRVANTFLFKRAPALG